MVPAGRRVTVKAELESVWVVTGLGTTTRHATLVDIIRPVRVLRLRAGHVRVDGAVRMIL